MKNTTSVHYSYLLLMAILSFILMFILMYMMVDKLENLYTNLNQFYMAGIMTGAIIVIEVLLMHSLFPNKWLNKLIMIFAIGMFILFIVLVRHQAAISDKEFLKSMIPHHASAILMCERAPLEDAELKNLCRTIITTQQAEIDWMRKKLSTFKK